MMKNSLNLLFILIFTLFLQSCIGAKPSSSRKSISSSVKTPTNTNNPTFAADESMYWFTSSKILGTITVNLNSTSVIYLRGQNVHNFLNAPDVTASNLAYYQNQKQYCMVGNFGSLYKQLRLRVVPIFTNNFTTKVTERMFRVDIPNEAENKAACPGVINSVAAADAAYTLKDICPSCLGATMLTSTGLSLFMGSATVVSELPLTKITLSSIKLKVDLQSNSTTGDN